MSLSSPSKPFHQFCAANVGNSSSIEDRKTIKEAERAYNSRTTNYQQLHSTRSNVTNWSSIQDRRTIEEAERAYNSRTTDHRQLYSTGSNVGNSSSIQDRETIKDAERAYNSRKTDHQQPHPIGYNYLSPPPPTFPLANLDAKSDVRYLSQGPNGAYQGASEQMGQSSYNPALTADMKKDQTSKVTLACCLGSCRIKFSPFHIENHIRVYHPWLEGCPLEHKRPHTVTNKPLPLHLLQDHYQRESSYCLTCNVHVDPYYNFVRHWNSEHHKVQTEHGAKLAEEAYL